MDLGFDEDLSVTCVELWSASEKLVTGTARAMIGGGVVIVVGGLVATLSGAFWAGSLLAACVGAMGVGVIAFEGVVFGTRSGIHQVLSPCRA